MTSRESEGTGAREPRSASRYAFDEVRKSIARQEAAAWGVRAKNGVFVMFSDRLDELRCDRRLGEEIVPLYATPAPSGLTKEERVKWMAVAYDPRTNTIVESCMCASRADAEHEAFGLRGNGYLVGVVALSGQQGARKEGGGSNA